MIYKYRNFLQQNKEINMHTLDLLLKGEFLFSYPSNFEDEDDCCIKFDSIMGRIEGRPNAILTVGCFCKCFDSIEMWNKYSNCGGICIGIKDESFGNDKNIRAIKIDETIKYSAPLNTQKYKHILPVCNVEYHNLKSNSVESVNDHSDITNINCELLQKKIFTKGLNFKYEKEYRAIAVTELIESPQKLKNGLLLHLSKSSIGEIFFSSEMKKENCNMVREALFKRLGDEIDKVDFYIIKRQNGKLKKFPYPFEN